MKKAVCISCTQHYQERVLPVEKALQAAGFACTYITSDFHHVTKTPLKLDLPNCIQIPTMPYTRNLSVRRIASHMKFSRDALRLVRQLQPDLLYVEVPPNSLSRQAALYKKKHPDTKLVLDLFDMWPESFPSSRLKQLLKLPFAIWAWFRNMGLSHADLVLTECDLFRQVVQKHCKDTPAKALYLCRSGATTEVPAQPPQQDSIHLCYLGSINNIIDIPAIAGLIGQVQKLRPATLHIIGDGETRQELVDAVTAAGAEVVFHGKIYDDGEKQAIFDQCSYGLNIMKPSVCIGLTMKSLDYFAGGLPIINTIPADTRELVERRKMGINLNRENPAETARLIAETTPGQRLEMSENTLQAFHSLFSQSVFHQTLLDHINKLTL